MNTFIVGYGENIITPELPCGLSGYGIYLDRQARSVLDDLKIRAVFIKDEKNNKILLISFDLIGFSVDFSDELRKCISSKFEIPFSGILISCIHTHSGPPTVKLRGMGIIDPAYMESVKEKMEKAVEIAISESDEAGAKWALEEIEPIGFNRVRGKLEPIDTSLGTIVFQKKKQNIYLVNYPCHAVTLGRNEKISADFPGRIAKEIENKGNKAIFLQGFCGDIDPFVNKVKWGSGTEEDIDFYGKHIASRLLKLGKHAVPFENPVISSMERRIKLPLQLKNEEELQEEMKNLTNLHDKNDEKYKRFLKEWLEESVKKLLQLKDNPYLKNVPIQIIKVGKLKLIGYPGEVFCEIGLNLREKFYPVFPCGYTNGDIGYIPTKETYENLRDYACYNAPKFYNCFPFSSEIENIFFNETETLLKKGV